MFISLYVYKMHSISHKDIVCLHSWKWLWFQWHEIFFVTFTVSIAPIRMSMHKMLSLFELFFLLTSVVSYQLQKLLWMFMSVVSAYWYVCFWKIVETVWKTQALPFTGCFTKYSHREEEYSQITYVCYKVIYKNTVRMLSSTYTFSKNIVLLYFLVYKNCKFYKTFSVQSHVWIFFCFLPLCCSIAWHMDQRHWCH